MRAHLLLLAGLSLAAAACATDAPVAPPAGEPPSASTVSVMATTYTVGTTTELQNALKNAQAGDVIVVRPGTYTGSKSTSGYSNAYFYSGRSGTSTAKIILRSEDPTRPAVLQGSTTSSGYVFYLTGDYWEVRDLKFSTGSKGVMLDNANRNLLYKIEVYNIGEEGVHFRDGSSYNTLESSRVHDTGKVTADYGEAVYVGSDKGKWGSYVKEANHNRARYSTLGPNVTAEHVDIKEGTTGTIIEHSTFRGSGITGANYADSFIDAKGNDAIIRYNTGNREGDSNVVDAFQVHSRETGWGLRNDFNNNTLNLDSSTPYVVNVASGSARVSANTRSPSGNMYKGNVTTY